MLSAKVSCVLRRKFPFLFQIAGMVCGHHALLLPLWGVGFHHLALHGIGSGLKQELNNPPRSLPPTIYTIMLSYIAMEGTTCNLKE